MSTRLSSKGFTLWFTGLPCSGKTTMACAVAKHLRRSGYLAEILDGDIIRKNISSDLGFSKEDRMANVKRVAFVADLLTRQGAVTLVSLVSPYRSMRLDARRRIGNFVEIYVRCPLSVCEKRDVKGMYRLARQGKVKSFTGVSDPYEEPLNPEIILDTDRMSVRNCVHSVEDYLKSKSWISGDNPLADHTMLYKVYEFAAHYQRGAGKTGGRALHYSSDRGG